MSDTESDNDNNNEKKKHGLSVQRSQGADRKIKVIKKYCQATGYMGLLLLKPTWQRGKPRAMITKNFTGPFLVPKNGLEGVGMSELKSLDTVTQDQDSDTDSTVGLSGDVRGSPRSGRPLGKPSQKSKGKRSKKNEPVRCHACGQVYDEQREDEGILWIFCGGPGPRGRGCQAFAAHATCWNIAGGKKVVELISSKYIRCKDCQEIENETSDDDDESPAEHTSSAGKRKSSAKHTSSARKRTSSSAKQSSSSANHQTNRGASKSNSQSGSHRESSQYYPSDDDFENQ